ncbi:hypothetical protein ABIF90_007208 [Bradyrhizobium japonicum]
MVSQSRRDSGIRSRARAAARRSTCGPDICSSPLLLISSETVARAWADNVILGSPPPESAYIAAARRLVDRGVVTISVNCGVSIRHQATVAASVDVPVALSSLLLLPKLLRRLQPSTKLAIITADSKQLGKDVLGLDDAADRSRVVVERGEGELKQMSLPAS